MNGSPTFPIPRPVPEEDCPHCGKRLTYTEGGIGYSAKIGVILRGIYDGPLYWACPHCQGAWHRFPRGDRLYAEAERWMPKQ